MTEKKYELRKRCPGLKAKKWTMGSKEAKQLKKELTEESPDCEITIRPKKTPRGRTIRKGSTRTKSHSWWNQ